MKLSPMLSAACALALTACAAQQPAPYTPPPRSQLDPLPSDLRLTNLERQLCQRWLLIFSASPLTQQNSCGNSSGSPSVSKPVAR